MQSIGIARVVTKSCKQVGSECRSDAAQKVHDLCADSHSVLHSVPFDSLLLYSPLVSPQFTHIFFLLFYYLLTSSARTTKCKVFKISGPKLGPE
jgi:hypothetical protein